jgi:hypothetical protein
MSGALRDLRRVPERFWSIGWRARSCVVKVQFRIRASRAFRTRRPSRLAWRAGKHLTAYPRIGMLGEHVVASRRARGRCPDAYRSWLNSSNEMPSCLRILKKSGAPIDWPP